MEITILRIISLILINNLLIKPIQIFINFIAQNILLRFIKCYTNPMPTYNNVY